MPSISHSILLYHHSVLDSVLLADAVKQRVALSGTLSGPQFIPSLNCNKPTSRQMPDASVYRYRGFNAS